MNKYRIFILLKNTKSFLTYTVEALDEQDAKNQVVKMRGVDDKEMIVWKFK